MFQNSDIFQKVAVGSAVSSAPAVRAVDRRSQPVAGVRVSFQVTLGGGSLSSTEQTTGADGIASVGWTVGPAPGLNVVVASAPNLNKLTYTARAKGPRVTQDRPDDVDGPQFHLVYAVPQDGEDHELDQDGTLSDSFDSAQAWLSQQTSGRRLRLDTFHGSADVTFVRLSQPDAYFVSLGARHVDALADELQTAGIRKPQKKYAIYYEGGGTHSCGFGMISGAAGTILLHAKVPGSSPCDSIPFANSRLDPPSYREFGMLHELMHSLGFVDPNAPHNNPASPYHVNDSNSDLMYAGPLPWRPATLDVGHDDYYGENVPTGVLNLKDSQYLDPHEGAAFSFPTPAVRLAQPRQEGLSVP